MGIRHRESQNRAAQPSLLLYTSAHFFVDFISVYLILGRIIHDDRLPAYLIIYNFCAFAVQMPLGVIADMLDRCEWLSVAGTAILAILVFPGRLVSISPATLAPLSPAALASLSPATPASLSPAALASLSPVAPALLSPAALAAVTGLGNALFHIGCGTKVLRWSGGTCRDSGIFVSSGALGLFFGRKCAGMVPAGAALWIPALSIYLILFLLTADSLLSGTIPERDYQKDSKKNRKRDCKKDSKEDCKKNDKEGRKKDSGKDYKKDSKAVHPDSRNGRHWHGGQIYLTVFCVGALALVVVLRSYLGIIVKFPWKADFPLLLVCCVVLGKMLGGVLADLFGESRTIAVSLLMTSLLFLVSSVPAAGMTALLLFNMTMPLTLTCMARVTGMPGLAFGLLTFALYLGCLPGLLGMVSASFLPVLYAAISLVSLALMLAVWRIRETN